MFAKTAAILFVFLSLPASSAADTPEEEQQAITALAGIPSNLQKNRDGTVRFVRFSKSIVTDEHVSRTAAFTQLDYLAVLNPNVTDGGLEHIGQLINLDTLFLSESSVTNATLARMGSLLENIKGEDIRPL